MKPADIRRGDIYFLDIPHYTGSEMGKNRPAIVVSCDALNRTSPCVTVVCCSGSNQRLELEEHMPVASTPLPSLALCEHIYTVDKSRLEDFLGALSAEELAGVDRGIAMGLFGLNPGLQVPQKGRQAVEDGERAHALEENSAKCRIQLLQTMAVEDKAKLEQAQREAARAGAQRDLLRGLFDELLDRVVGVGA